MNIRFKIQALCFVLLLGFSQAPCVWGLQAESKKESTDPYFKSPKRDALPRILNQNPKSQAWVQNTGNPKPTGAQGVHQKMPKVFDVDGKRILPTQVPDLSKKVVNNRFNQGVTSGSLKPVGAQAIGNLSAQSAETRTPVRLPDYLTIEPPSKPTIAQPRVELEDDPEWKKRLAEIPWAKSPLNPDYKPDFSTANAPDTSSQNMRPSFPKVQSPVTTQQTPLVPNNIPLTPNRYAALQPPNFGAQNHKAAATSPSLNRTPKISGPYTEVTAAKQTVKPVKVDQAVERATLLDSQNDTDNDFVPQPAAVQNPFFRNQTLKPTDSKEEKLVVQMPPENGIPVTRIKHPNGLTSGNDFSISGSSQDELPKIRSLASTSPRKFSPLENSQHFQANVNQFQTNEGRLTSANGFQVVDNPPTTSTSLNPITNPRTVRNQEAASSVNSDFQPPTTPSSSQNSGAFQSGMANPKGLPTRSIINPTKSAPPTSGMMSGAGTFEPKTVGETDSEFTSTGPYESPKAVVKQTVQTKKPIVPTQTQDSADNEFEPGRVLALVGGEPIFVGDIMFEVNQMIERFAAGAPEEIKKQQRPLLIKRLLPKFIDSKILFVATVRDLPEQANLDDILEQASSQFDEQVMSKMMEQMGVETSAEFDAHLRLMGSSLRKLRRSWSEEQFVRFFLSQQLQVDTEVTHQEMLDYYKKYSADYEVEARARWEQVMVRKDKYPTSAAAKNALAQLGNKIIYGAKLEAVAKENSHGFMARNGGQHDWTTKDALVLKEIDRAIFTLEVGELSDIIESRDGFHIIRVLEREDAGKRSFLEAQVEIKKRLADDKRESAFQHHLQKLKEQIPVEIYDFAGHESVSGKTYTIDR